MSLRPRSLALAAFGILALVPPLATTAGDSARLLTAHQAQVQALASSLRGDPAIQSARAQARARLLLAQPAALADGKTQLDAALDELLNGMLLAAAGNDPARPRVVWTESLAYSSSTGRVPGTRYAGDNPDRIYRSIAASAAYRYEIRGKRDASAPSLDFNFGVIKKPGFWGEALGALPSQNIDVAQDGTFTVTADATPANGRRNHLQLPPETAAIAVRDTLADWSRQLPNFISVRRIDDAKAAVPTPDARVRDAVEQFDGAIDKTLKFLDEKVWNQPANQLVAFERPLSWGLQGALFAVGRFALEPDQALIITLEPVTARYVAVQVADPWLRSAAYDERSTSLNNSQAQPNADGSLTLVLSAQDPGVLNWLDTGGLHDGVLFLRWELMSHPDVAGAVREVKTVALSKIGAALPMSMPRITTAERKRLLAERKAAYQRRLQP